MQRTHSPEEPVSANRSCDEAASRKPSRLVYETKDINRKSVLVVLEDGDVARRSQFGTDDVIGTMAMYYEVPAFQYHMPPSPVTFSPSCLPRSDRETLIELGGVVENFGRKHHQPSP